jgi:hypothetical protein
VYNHNSHEKEDDYFENSQLNSLVIVGKSKLDAEIDLVTKTSDLSLLKLNNSLDL